ncbi:DNRLRE domain-containing protein, partial [bacterium]|nr:DNRLRE domain-containing protein [bacterium]
GASGVITKATLRLYVTDSGSEGGAVYQVSNDYHGSNKPWQEAGLKWPNAPRLEGDPLASTGAVKAGEFVEFDVTASIAADGTYSYAISNTSGDAVRYTSKEGPISPELIIEATNGNTAAKFSSTSDQDPEKAGQTRQMPEDVVLGANYPNPFNIETTIQYGLPNATHVRLEIYNIHGQLIRTLVDGPQPPGLKRVKWNGSNEFGLEVSSGVYFAKLRTEKIILTEKLILQK